MALDGSLKNCGIRNTKLEIQNPVQCTISKRATSEKIRSITLKEKDVINIDEQICFIGLKITVIASIWL